MALPPTVLVTGAAGFVGSHLLDRLPHGDARIVGWRRPGESLPPAPTGTACEWMEVDILDRAAVEAAVAAKPPAMVCHLAGVAHVGHSWDRAAHTLAVNVLGTHHLLSAVAAVAPACRVLIAGSALVYRPQDRALSEDDPLGPVSPYGLSKLAQEMAAVQAFAESGLPVVVTRSFNHIGPRQDPSFSTASFARQIARIEAGLAPPAVQAGNLDARRDLTDVRDTVEAYRALLARGQPGRVYNVCRGVAYRVGDILEGLRAQARVPIEIRTDAALLRRHDVPLMLGSGARLERELGWTPRIPIERTLADILEFWRAAVAAETGRGGDAAT
ncbi:MAG: NAD-dependent epimerase/dehydratase family protein [Acidobacteria bacterium]|nr:MAG: NAD-dependent epimerase/dehydratase family protein [Acidobacteriota bacterium]